MLNKAQKVRYHQDCLLCFKLMYSGSCMEMGMFYSNLISQWQISDTNSFSQCTQMPVDLYYEASMIRVKLAQKKYVFLVYLKFFFYLGPVQLALRYIKE